ncbi:MAG: DUF559 domain-containing protein [Bauldia sp.]|nr:DUF559 domain-containing protein [Bauldia sp.]
MTEPELRLWLTIRNGGLSGLRFRRQAPYRRLPLPNGAFDPRGRRQPALV